MAIVHFTSSDTFIEADPTGRACAHAEIEITGYIEGTYEMLRQEDQRDALEFANYINGGWELLDGRRFSDWSVAV